MIARSSDFDRPTPCAEVPSTRSLQLEEGMVESVLKDLEPRIHSAWRRFGIPPQDRDDVLQQTLVAWLLQSKPIHNPRGWLAVVLDMQCRLYWRHRGRRRDAPMDPNLLADLAGGVRAEQEGADLRRDLGRLGRRLPDSWREILRLRFLLGYENREIAESTGYRPSSIGKLTSRGLASLGRKLVASDFTS